MEDIEHRRKQRLQFLHELYRLTNGNENTYAILDRIRYDRLSLRIDIIQE
ncbi:MAG TPA: hypothetical protein VFJ05_05985 [Nitrososphaeraceae archaeon]|nr:hypothetical protein [Nitrososphaeraceae archaeon]